MKRFHKIKLLVLVGLLLTGCADKSIQKEAILAANDQEEQRAEALSNTLQIDSHQKKSIQDANASKENSHKKEIQTEGWRIQSDCSKITDQTAQAVFDDVRELEKELCDGIYAIENSRIVFLHEEAQEGAVIVRAVFEADYTSIRKPEDHPLIQGMYEAKAKLKSDQEKKDADAYIDGWLTEFYPTYQKTERVPLNIAVKMNDDQTQEYELYYPFVKNSKEKLKPLREYARKNWKEDTTEMKKTGKLRLLESVVHQ